MKKNYKVGWYNGYYATYAFVRARSEKEAIKKAKQLYGKPRAFDWGENPASNCGIYGEPVAILDLTTPNEDIERKMLNDGIKMSLRGY